MMSPKATLISTLLILSTLSLLHAQTNQTSMNKKVQQVKPKDTPRILREFEAKLAVEYERDTGPTSSIYRLKDGRMMILGNSDNWGVIYPNEASLQEVLNYEPKESTWHMVASYEGYVDDIPNLVEKFRKQLGLTAKTLDGSLLSLKMVDRKLHKLFKSSDDPDQMADELFPGLIAYCTQVLAQELKGEIFLQRVDEEVLYLSVKTDDGKVFTALPSVSKELTENLIDCSIYHTIDAEMYKYGLG